MARIVNHLLAAAGLSLGLAAGASAQAPADPVLVEVDGRAFTLDELIRFYLERHDGHIKLLREERSLESLMERFRDFQLLVACACSEGLDQDPELTEMLDDIRRREAMQRWLKAETDDKVVVERPEIDEYAERLLIEYKLREIGTTSKAEAARALAELEAGADFGEVAARRSNLSSRVRKGYGEPRRIDKLPIAVADWLRTAEAGARSGILTAPRGFLIVELFAAEEVAPPEGFLDDTRLMSELAQIRRERLSLALRERLRAAADARLAVEIEPGWFAADSAADGALVLAAAEGIEPVTLEGVRASLAIPAEMMGDGELVTEVAAFAAMQRLDERLQLRAALASDFATHPEVERQIAAAREDLLVKALKGKIIFAELEIPLADLQKIYEENREQFRVQPRAEIRHILVATEAEAVEIAAALSGGADWTKLAEERSLDPGTAPAGGYVGWVNPKAILPELDAVVFDLEIGTVSPPIQTRAGWHLLSVVRRQAGSDLPFEAVRERILEKEIQRLRLVELARWNELLRERVAWSFRKENLGVAVAEIQRRIAAEDAPAVEPAPGF